MNKINSNKNQNYNYTGIHKEVTSEMQLFVYEHTDFKEYTAVDFETINEHINPEKTNWINLHGLNAIDLIEKIAIRFNFDSFIVDNILNTKRRTRLEEQHDLLFFNIKSILPSNKKDGVKIEQISFLIKDGVLISFQEKRSDFFGHIRERIRSNSGIIRNKKSDYLLFMLLDAVMENFYTTIENEEDQIEILIDQVKIAATPIIVEKIETHRDNLNLLKRAITPLRDSLYDIKSIKDDDIFNAIEAENFTFFARLYQKSLELLDQVDGNMNLLDSASNFYFSAQSHKMNEVMKTLTIISSIFIPLTFIVGIYGMNFENMPELKLKNGYFTVILVMILIVILMIYYFKKRKWF